MSMRPRGWSFPADCQPRLRGVTTTAARRPDRVAAHAVHWVEHTHVTRAHGFWSQVSVCDGGAGVRPGHTTAPVGLGLDRRATKDWRRRARTVGSHLALASDNARSGARRLGCVVQICCDPERGGEGREGTASKAAAQLLAGGATRPLSLRWVCRTCNASRCRARCVSSLAVPPFCLPSLCVRQGTAPPRHGGVPTRPLRATLFLFACILFFRSLCVLVPSPSVVPLPQERRSPIRTGSGDLGLTATARGRARGGK